MTHGISRGARKLVRTPILIKKKKKKEGECGLTLHLSLQISASNYVKQII
jgi:hypothetical protein